MITVTLSASSDSGVSTLEAVTVSASRTAVTASLNSTSVLETWTRVDGAASPGAHATHLDTGASRQVVDLKRAGAVRDDGDGARPWRPTP